MWHIDHGTGQGGGERGGREGGREGGRDGGREERECNYPRCITQCAYISARVKRYFYNTSDHNCISCECAIHRPTNTGVV